MNNAWKSPLAILEDAECLARSFALPTNWAVAFQGLSVYETEDEAVVEVALPGLNEKEIEITFDKGHLIVRGEKRESEEEKKRHYLRRASRSFTYQLSLPESVDDTLDPQAEFTEGIVKITFQKQKKGEPRRIPIQKK